jgi:two-component system cell cycle response regulator CtrA
MKLMCVGLDTTTVLFLRQQGIAVEVVKPDEIEDLCDWLADGQFGALVINVEQSGQGIYLSRGVRTEKIGTPIIGISAGSDGCSWSEYRARFLENGGDDLLEHPASPRELLASVRAVTRRYAGSLVDYHEFVNGTVRLKINMVTSLVTVNDLAIELTGKERLTLLALAAAPGRVLTKEMLMNSLYAGTPDEEPELKIIDVFICKLRKKLSEKHPDAGAFVQTVWGRGYALKTESVGKRSV